MAAISKRKAYLLLFALLSPLARAAHVSTAVECDVVVVGGSLASLAAALTAANTTKATVCFLEATDWPGGQLTASAVPAIDFGPLNRVVANLPASFVDMIWSQYPGDFNPGNCWVSTKCFDPAHVVRNWIFPTLAKFPNLHVLLNTVVTASRRGSDGAINYIEAVRRTPKTDPWVRTLSEQVEDWYSLDESDFFSKELLAFSNFSVAIEASEFGDLLATSGVALAQGFETPEEMSTDYYSACGQGVTVPFYMHWATTNVTDHVPPGSDCGMPFTSEGNPWAKIWSYRRVHAMPGTSQLVAKPGDVSNQNWAGGNDLDNAYIFSIPSALEPWRGGLNVTALGLSEQRAYGWYHFYRNLSGTRAGQLQLERNYSDTRHGLSKMPYLRDTRRSARGLYGFRICYAHLSLNTSDCSPTAPHPPPSATAFRFPDTIGIGQYFYADIHKMKQNCPFPPYLANASGSHTLPYHLPFRALTVEESPNMLVAGKSMSQTFWANAGTRLHPEEWVTGVAAGAAAALMHDRKWSSEDVFRNINVLQQSLRDLGQPLEWTM